MDTCINQKVEDNNIRSNNKINNKEQRKFLSNYENQREYSKEFLESLYANRYFNYQTTLKMLNTIFFELSIDKILVIVYYFAKGENRNV